MDIDTFLLFMALMAAPILFIVAPALLVVAILTKNKE